MAGYSDSSHRDSRLGVAWLVLTFALALHILDEALTNFLGIYNPTARVLRAQYPWFPAPALDFRTWLTGLICGLLIMLALTPFFYRNVLWVRPLGYIMAVLNILNALGHTRATILGRTVASVHFPRPAPGFYSSPFLLIASLYLLYALMASRRRPLHSTAARAG